jgi:hypothetical protein
MSLPLEQIVSVSLLTPMGDPDDKKCVWGMPLLIWGSPGIGKSTRVAAAARAAGLHLEPVFSAGQHPEDFTGIPVRKADGGLHRVCALEEVNRLVEMGRGVLFLDEVSCAPPTVQAALLKVVMNRYIGDTQLPGGVRIISAANPAEEAAGGWELEPPLANRFVHIQESPPTAQEWTEWLINGENVEVTDYKSGEKMVRDSWDSEYPRMKGLMAGFVKRRPNLLYNLPKEGDRARGRAWPSPRTCEYAARMAATCGCLSLGMDSQMDFVQAAIGEAAAAEWAAWVQDADLPSPETMLRNGWTPDPHRLDRSVAAYTGVAAFVVGCKDLQARKNYAIKAWGLYDKACKAGVADVIMVATQAFINNGLSLSAGADMAEAAKPVLSRLGDSGLAKLSTTLK